LPVNIACAGASWGGSMADGLKMLHVLGNTRPPHHIVGWRGRQELSYGMFLGRVGAWRALLARVSGQRFALYLDDSVELAAALFGAWQAGKTICLPGDNLPATCAGLRPKVDGYLGEFAIAWQPQVPVQDAAADLDAFHPLDPDFPGLVLYTSGSTATPQSIPKRLAQLAAEVDTLEMQFGALLGAADIAATVSHQHIYGLLFKVLWPITAGRAIHAGSFSFFEGLSAALAQRESALVSSPAHLKRLRENSVPAPAIKRLKLVFSSGGPLAFEVAQECQRILGRLPVEVYGSSETGGIAWRQQAGRMDRSWRPFPGVHWRVDHASGVLEVRSEYLPSPDWFRTADRAAAAAGGGFVLDGRVDRIAKIEGKRISLSAIESLLAASSLVAAARVIVLEEGRQRVAAFVVLTESGRQRLAELGRLYFSRSLRNLLVDAIEAVGLPRIWRYPDALPVNGQGKTTVADLRILLEGASSRPTEPRKRLLAKDPHAAVFELVAPRNLLYFNGHFPRHPIVPGVVQLDWVIACGRQCFDLPPLFRGVHALKFQRVIPPETPVRLEVVYDRVKSSLGFQITSDRGRHATGRILFGAADV
jgi:acyl-coenzyme A synthetase/AMP-(fatty) acid ligase